MDLVASIALTCLGVFVFVHAISFIIVTSRLIKMQLWNMTITLVARAEAAQILPVLDAARPVLDEHGFVYVNTHRIGKLMVSLSAPWHYVDNYYHPELGVHASVTVGEIPMPRAPFDINLSNFFADGQTLTTMNGTALFRFARADSATVVDAGGVSFALQLALHLKERAHFSAPALSAAEMDAASPAKLAGILPGMVERGEAYRCGELNGEALYALRLLTAIKVAWKMRAGIRTFKAIESKRNKENTPPVAAPEVQLAAERLAFVNGLSVINDLRAPRWFRWSAFVLSAGAFIGLGTWWWGMGAALVIAAVVAFHEAGHWLAMRLAGFRDVQVFFVPGMGAATSGEKHDASPLVHLAVFLAGPLPGLLLAMCGIGGLMLLPVEPHAWWYSALTTAIGAAFLINFVNLLPVMPLDGGRVIDLFVMGRLPWFRFGFALVSGVLLLVTGLTSDDNVLLGLGILAFVAMGHQYNMAKVSRALLRETRTAPLASESFSAAAGRLFDFLARPEYRKWNVVAKMGIAQAILPRFLGRLPGARETLLGLSIYIAAIVVPLGMVAALAINKPQAFKVLVPINTSAITSALGQNASVPDTSLRQSNDATLAATAPADRIKVLGELLDAASEAEDDEEMLRIGRLYYTESAALPAPSRERARAALELSYALHAGDGKENEAEAARLLKESEQLLRTRLNTRQDSVDAFLLTSVLSAREPSDDVAAVIAIREEIVDIHAQFARQSGETLAFKRTSLAHAYYDGGRLKEAEAQLVLAARELARLPAPSRYTTDELALDHGWFLMANRRPQEALTHLAPYLAKAPDKEMGMYSFNRNAHLLAAMAARALGRWDEVKAHTSPLLKFDLPVREGKVVRLFADSATASRFDLRAGLLLVEAERQLGHGPVADKLVADMRAQYAGRKKGTPACHINGEYDDWREQMNAAVRDNEKREFKCEEPPPPLKCPVPAVAPA